LFLGLKYRFFCVSYYGNVVESGYKPAFEHLTPLHGDINQLSSIYLPLPGDINQLSSTYLSLQGDINQLSSIYLPLPGEINQLSSNYLPLQGDINQLSSPYWPLQGDINLFYFEPRLNSTKWHFTTLLFREIKNLLSLKFPRPILSKKHPSLRFACFLGKIGLGNLW